MGGIRGGGGHEKIRQGEGRGTRTSSRGHSSECVGMADRRQKKERIQKWKKGLKEIAEFITALFERGYGIFRP